MAIAERVARTYSLEVFDVQFRREAHGWVVRVYLDRADRTEPAADGAAQAGVNVADCERVSRDLGAILDVEDVVNRAYTLEVSSPGLDRPLRAAADYRRFAGQRVKMVVTEPVDNQKFLTGRLRGLEEDAGGTVLLEGHGGRLHRIPLAIVSRANLDVELSSAGERRGRPVNDKR